MKIQSRLVIPKSIQQDISEEWAYLNRLRNQMSQVNMYHNLPIKLCESIIPTINCKISNKNILTRLQQIGRVE